MTKPLLYQHRHKLRAGAWTATAFAIGVLFPQPLANLFGVDAWIAAAICAMAFGSSFWILAHGMKCPACGVNLFWHGLGNAKYGNWLRWMKTLSLCPKCGFRHPEQPPTRTQNSHRYE